MAVKILNGVDVVGNMNITASDVPNLDANKITSGTIGSARIPNLAASKIASGTLSTARIPNLDAGKITSGTFHSDRMPDLSATYATASHNHDTRYASIAHTHDGMYLRTGVTLSNFADVDTIEDNRVVGLTSYTGAPYANHNIVATFINHASGGRRAQLFFGDTPNAGAWFRLRQGADVQHDWYKLWNSFDFTSTNISNWNTAYSWGDHDGLYAAASHTHNYDNYGSWNLKTNSVQRTTVGSGGDLNLVAGTNVSLSYSAGGTVTISSTDTNTDTNNYLTGLSFSTSNGVLTATRQGLSDLTVDLDGRYALAGDENIIDGAYTIWNPDGDGDVFSYSDSNPTHNGKYVGAVIDVRGDGTSLSSLWRTGTLTADHVQVSRGYYVGGILDSNSSDGVQVIDANGNWVGNAPTPAAHTHSEYLTSVPSEYLTQTEGDARYLQSLPSHNHDDRYYTETEVNNLIAAHTGWQTNSNFVNGTLVRTDIDASVTNGDSFLLRVVGKSYQTDHSPFDLLLQGYIYNNTFISYSAIVNSTAGLGDIKILELDGQLCFWWARFSYWNSFEIYVTKVSGQDTTPSNRVVGVEDVVEPDSTLGKKVSVTPYESWTSKEFNSGHVTNWNNAYSWGNHATAGYLTSYTETDTLQSVTDRGSTTTNSITVANITANQGYFGSTGTNPQVRIFTENASASIADTFTDTTTDKSYIYFMAGTNSNDPAYIMHETSENASPDERNEGVLHLVPSDDNNDADYVSIHGTNDPDALRLSTTGKITTSSSYQLTLDSGSGYVRVRDGLSVQSQINTDSHGDSSQWNTAYGWGNHATAGYLTSVPNHSAALITSGTLAAARLSGTYNISVSGSSASSNRLNRDDNRTISPSEDSNGSMSFGFTSWTNNNTGGWADYLHLRSYTDSSGGNDNLVMFSKDSIEMRIWQQSYNSSTPYSNYRDVAFKDELQTPAITSNGSTPSLNTGITASEIRTLINAEENGTTLPLTGGTLTGNINANGSILGDGNLFLRSYNNDPKGIFFRQGFEYGNTNQYNLSITCYDDGDGAADGMMISAYDGVFFNVQSGSTPNTKFRVLNNEVKAFVNLISTGNVYASGGNSTEWNSAYDWGNHATAGYQSAIAQPAPPAAASCAVVGDTIEVSFDPSPETVDYYQVWASQDGGSYSMISQIPKQDFAPFMTVVDTAFSVSGTRAYRVYAVKYGVYSDPATTSRSYTQTALEPVNMNVVPMEESFFIQWDAPASRFVDHYEVWVDTNATQSSLSRNNATLAYSGNNTFYMHNASNNEFHQFWVEITES